MKKKLIKIIGIVAGVILVLGIGIAIYVNSILNTGFDIDKTVYITIDSNKDYKKLRSDLEKTANIESISNFDKVAEWLRFNTLKTGRYAITPDMTAVELVRILRLGTQSPIKITFNNMRTKENLAQRLSDQLMVSKEELLDAMNDAETCNAYGFTTETIGAMFIPNTYEVYWDMSVDGLMKRMNKEYVAFWNEGRKEKAKSIDLSPVKVSILASIVEEECTYSDEYPMVAGLYLNRLKRGQKLQADPTVKFALADFELRRILNKHLAVDSPYNTYRAMGLPPGPIRIPSIKGIDAVLNHATHKYLYMCAKEDFSGRHNFATTLAQHNANAAKYRNALNRRQIYQ